jgi:hypothetical protein
MIFNEQCLRPPHPPLRGTFSHPRWEKDSLGIPINGNFNPVTRHTNPSLPLHDTTPSFSSTLK